MKPNIKENFEHIYHRESDSIFRFCLIHVLNKDEALKITEEVFRRLYLRMYQEKGLFNKKIYIFSTAHRLIVDYHLKNHSLSEEGFLINETDMYEIQNGVNLEQSGIGSSGRVLLEKIKDLENTYRQPVYLHFIEDLSLGEVSEIIGMSPNAVSTRIDQGLERLKMTFA